uniref:Uncharacterized protein n=1 Tax=Triticum urartu TaxID=4572 RepID=A0A8R7V203_TRIUA
MGLPLRLGLETLGVGGAPPDLGGKSPLGRRPPLEMGSPRAGAPPRGPIYSAGRDGSRTQVPGASLSPRNTSPSRCFHHHAVVLLDLHQPLLLLAGSRRRRRLPNRTCVERGGAVRSALGHR